MTFNATKRVEGAAGTTIALGGYNKKLGKENAKQITGFYLGTRTVPDAKQKSGEAQIHSFKTTDGENVDVWGKTDLNKKMTGATIGLLTQVTVSGTRKTPNGDMYVFNVDIDEGQTLESFLAAGETEEEYDDNPNAEFDAPAEAPMRNTAPKTPQAAPDAGRQAKVKALLGSKRATA